MYLFFGGDILIMIVDFFFFFQVHSTMKVGERKLVISLDHDKAAHYRAAYVSPSSSP